MTETPAQPPPRRHQMPAGHRQAIRTARVTYWAIGGVLATAVGALSSWQLGPVGVFAHVVPIVAGCAVAFGCGVIQEALFEWWGLLDHAPAASAIDEPVGRER